ncbi:MAG: TIGR03936 family radical SAM-associated protein [Propionibacteriaceae bacterium]
MARQQPEQQAPPVQRLRFRYAKRGPARFTSTRDFSRAFERALRRAEIPMAYSSGYSPHPRISYANAAPTGAATEAEYVEIGLAQICDPAKVCAVLDEALPPGMSLEQVAEASGESLGERFPASEWVVDLAGVEDSITAAVAALLAAETIEVTRDTKKGLRTFDARAAVVAASVDSPTQLHLVMLQGKPLVRPDDVVNAMASVCPQFVPTAPPLLTRLAQGPLVDGVIGDPLA